MAGSRGTSHQGSELAPFAATEYRRNGDKFHQFPGHQQLFGTGHGNPYPDPSHRRHAGRRCPGGSDFRQISRTEYRHGGIGDFLHPTLPAGIRKRLAHAEHGDPSRVSERVQLHASRSTVLATINEARTAWWMQRSLESVLAAHIQDTTRTWRLLVNARQNLTSGAGSVLDTIRAVPTTSRPSATG